METETQTQPVEAPVVPAGEGESEQSDVVVVADTASAQVTDVEKGPKLTPVTGVVAVLVFAVLVAVVLRWRKKD